MSGSPPGAYGLRPTAPFEIPAELLVPGPEDWLAWAFDWTITTDLDGAARPGGLFVGAQEARLPVLPRGYVEINRAEAWSHFFLDHPMTDAELLHPGMASTAAVVAWWSGRLALHGASAVHRGSAIAFLGDREQGKSSTIAWLRRNGWESMADDVVVIDGSRVTAGPRVVDLRENTARQWSMGQDVGILGQRRRWRVECDVVPSSAVLGAVVDLRWGERISVDRLSATRRFQLYADHNVLQIPPRNGSSLLTLVGVPTFTFTRPKDLSRMEEAMAALLRVVGEPRGLQ